ncbi:MAG: hypothetical protein WB689_02290 [Xanthobacteraceae bacterium]
MAKTEPNNVREEYNLKKPKARWCGVMRKAIGLVQRPMVKQELLPYWLSDRDSSQWCVHASGVFVAGERSSIGFVF